MARNVTEIQRRFIELGYLAAGEDDGTFGPVTLAAYNRFRASKGEPPHTGLLLLVEISADVFPEDAPPPKPPASNPITDFFTGLAVKAALSQLKGLIPMNGLLATGTAITGVLMILVGAASLITQIIPLGPVSGFSPLTPGEAVTNIMQGVGLIFVRRAIAKNGTGA